jgi:phosphatidylglycerophosphate synthase
MGALLFAHHDAATDGPSSIRRAGGLTILERQVRLVQRAGCAPIIVYAERIAPELAAIIGRLGASVELVRGGEALAAAVVGMETVVTLAEGLVADERLVDLVATAQGPLFLTWPDSSTSAGERIDAATLSGGIAKLPAALVSSTASALGDWDIQSTLLRALVASGARRTDIAGLDRYAAARRREVPFVWELVATAEDEARATHALLASAQKGCLDWPARFLHPPVENALTRLLLDTRVTPNMVTVATGVIGAAAAVAFATGWLWTGLLLALLIGPLDGVDGKLARTRVEYSRWGDLEHVLDKVVEYLWYLCLAGWFAVGEGREGAWPIAALIILFALAEAAQGEFYRRFTGNQLDDAGPLERRFRVFAGRRNTFFWTLVPFGALALWYPGFVALAAYAVVTFFVAQWRFFVRLGEYGRGVSSQIDVNFRRTDYAFLPAKDASTS